MGRSRDSTQEGNRLYLLDDYASIYDPSNKNHAESIFEIQYWDDQAAGQQSDFAYNFLPILSNPGLIEGFPDGNTNNYAGWNIPTPEMNCSLRTGRQTEGSIYRISSLETCHTIILDSLM